MWGMCWRIVVILMIFDFNIDLNGSIVEYVRCIVVMKECVMDILFYDMMVDCVMGVLLVVLCVIV